MFMNFQNFYGGDNMSIFLGVIFASLVLYNILVSIYIIKEEDWYTPLDKIVKILLVFIVPILGALYVFRELKRLDQKFILTFLNKNIIKKEELEATEFKVIGEYKSSKKRPKKYYGNNSSSSSSAYSDTYSATYYDEGGGGGE